VIHGLLRKNYGLPTETFRTTSSQKGRPVNTQLVRALLNPMRIRIFDVVAEGPASPSQLAEALDQSLALISYHVDVLRSTGCLQPSGRARPKRGQQCVYELAPGALPARRRASQRRGGPPLFGHPSAGALRTMVDKEIVGFGPSVTGERRDRVGCMSLVLDRQGMVRVSTAIARALDQVSIAQEESERRLAGTGEGAIEATIAVASFNSPANSAAESC
jgi:Helix-turn-helix domain